MAFCGTEKTKDPSFLTKKKQQKDHSGPQTSFEITGEGRLGHWAHKRTGPCQYYFRSQSLVA